MNVYGIHDRPSNDIALDAHRVVLRLVKELSVGNSFAAVDAYLHGLGLDDGEWYLRWRQDTASVRDRAAAGQIR